MVNTHGITDDQMISLDAMRLEAALLVDSELHKHHRGKEGKHHGCRGRGRRAFVAGELLVMIAEIEANLPLDHRLHEQPHDSEHSQRRNPFRFL
jgi:hypothetical protein